MGSLVSIDFRSARICYAVLLVIPTLLFDISCRCSGDTCNVITFMVKDIRPDKLKDAKRAGVSNLSPEPPRPPDVLASQSGKERTASKRAKTHRDEESCTGSSISFPVKRSGLASKNLDAQVSFIPGQPDDPLTRDVVDTSPPHAELAVRPTDSHIPESFPKKKRRHNSSGSGKISKDVSSSFDKRSSSPRLGSNSAPKRANSCNKVKNSPRTDRAGNIYKNEQTESLSENDTEAGSGGRITDGHERSPLDRPSTSASLVAYNSSEEDHMDVPRKCSKGGKQKRRSGSPNKSSPQEDSNELDPDPVHPSSVPNSAGVSKKLKVVKTTAKSTWDSSDSEFEASTVAARGSTSAPTVSALSNEISPQTTSCTQPTPQVELSKKHKRSFKRCAPESDVAIDRESTREKKQQDPAVSTEVQPQSHRSSKREKQKLPRHKRRRSYSSHSSVSPAHMSRGRPVPENEDHSEYPVDARRQSFSHDSVSSRSSDNESQYSTASSHSGSWRRHRRRHRRRSKSYTSRSSSRGSSNLSRGYRDRTKSRSRSGRRRRRRVRSSYRRSRRRSYSSRSHSRSRSWRTSESSSYRSSRSSSRASSPVSHRRSSALRRSSSRPSPVHRKLVSGSKLSSGERSRSPENRLARLGVGPLGRGSNAEQRASDALTTSFSLSSVADTVSAAVKRVTGGNNVSGSKKLPDSVASHSQPTLGVSERPKQEPIVTSGKSTLVDIPLPLDAGHSTAEQLPSHTETAPYIGPQLPPELAKRFGLSVSQQSPTEKESSNRASLETAVTNTPSNSNPQNSNDSTTSQSNSMEFLIPPEKVEQYRALQEQAKQHALRRSNLLMTGESAEVTTTASIPSEAELHSQRLALLVSAGLVYPAYSGDASLLTPVNSNTTSLAVTDSGANQNFVRLAEDARLAALNTQIHNQLWTSMASLGQQNTAIRSMAGSDQLAAALAGGKASTYDTPSVPAVLPASLHQQLQHAQLQQLVAAANAIQAAQSGGNTVQTQQAQPVITAQLLQQLAIQQAQKIQTASLPANAIAASVLSAHLQQQQKLQAQLLRQTNDPLKSQTDGHLTPVSLFNDATSSASYMSPICTVAVNGPIGAASPLSSSLVRNPVAGATTVTNPVVSALSLKTAQQTQALLNAAQQQQLLAAVLRQQQATAIGLGLSQETAAQPEKPIGWENIMPTEAANRTKDWVLTSFRGGTSPPNDSINLYNRVKRYKRILSEETSHMLRVTYEIEAPKPVDTFVLNMKLLQLRKEIRNFLRVTEPLFQLEETLFDTIYGMNRRSRYRTNDIVASISNLTHMIKGEVVSLTCHISECIRWLRRKSAGNEDLYFQVYRAVEADLAQYEKAMNEEFEALEFFLNEYISCLKASDPMHYQNGEEPVLRRVVKKLPRVRLDNQNGQQED
ncbi:hypothetical protein CRM22_003900 [Opisthorchis felineus]|uniref:Uncharacterized protein n=1 Tax=Opisthorchis felineus TaxID=147828 RepID=A0A4S2M519_OPIFE|nr:hypothetical protein CRM22_003900 [Opisthorchis felineus]